MKSLGTGLLIVLIIIVVGALIISPLQSPNFSKLLDTGELIVVAIVLGIVAVAGLLIGTGGAYNIGGSGNRNGDNNYTTIITNPGPSREVQDWMNGNGGKNG